MNRGPLALGFLLPVLLGLTLSGGPARAADRLEVGRQDARLWARYSLDTLFDDEIWSSLRSGLPSRVRHRVTLWQDRSPLWDRRVEEWSGSYRVVYDLIEETYDLFDEEGLLESNLDAPEVVERVASASAVPVLAMKDLDAKDRYYVEVLVEVQPLTVEEVRDLERWLSGRLRGREGLGRLSSQVIGMFKSRVGLGERSRALRTPTFRRSEVEPFDLPSEDR